jgi:hypothetical protein
MYVYDTLSQAVNGLRERGYSMDFSLDEKNLICKGEKLNVEDFEIVEVHRFEGHSNPDDSSVLYAIESKKGHKGIMISAYGMYSEGISLEMAQKLTMHIKSDSDN